MFYFIIENFWALPAPPYVEFNLLNINRHFTPRMFSIALLSTPRADLLRLGWARGSDYVCGSVHVCGFSFILRYDFVRAA